MKPLTVWHFSYEYHQEFLGYEPLKMYYFFPLLGGFLRITSFIGMLQALLFQFKVHGFIAYFLIRNHLRRNLLGLKLDL